MNYQFSAAKLRKCPKPSIYITITGEKRGTPNAPTILTVFCHLNIQVRHRASFYLNQRCGNLKYNKIKNLKTNLYKEDI